MREASNYSKNSVVKNIYIQLPYYRYKHGPIEFGDKDINSRFIGRTKETKQLINILKNSGETGAYLVTGYRGMGKTSFVNRALSQYDNETSKKIEVVTICLNQSEIKLKDVYIQIARGVKNVLHKEEFEKYRSLDFPIALLLISSVILLVGFSILFQTKIAEYILGFLALTIFISGIISLLFYNARLSLKRKSNSDFKIYEKLEEVIGRATSEVVKEQGTQGAGNRFIFGFISKSTRKYPLSTARDIEQELLQILLDYRKLNNNKEVIIIFDELDKVEPTTRTQFYLEEKNEIVESDISRKRRKVIIDILGSLKHFITRANAKFIFIAGREMFDASLADINDRQSSISSIFHQIINVDSFLKEKSYKNSRGVTNLIEQYLKELLIPPSHYSDLVPEGYNTVSFLKLYYNILPNYLKDTEKQKVIFVLQQLIIYLTYRSNGAPNKLNRLVEDLIVNEPLDKKPWKYIKVLGNDLKIKPKSSQKPNIEDKGDLFLKLSVSNQYRYAFISYLYRPFILTYSHYLKEYSDQVLVATPYLMDHLIKFHPFAFSLQDIELIPEVLSSNRQPIIRYFTDEIVSFLNKNMIRRTEIGLFDYKYFKKVQNELEYISKIFEDESAAFNFTLDENHNVKLQIRNRIRDLRAIYKDYLPLNGSKQVFSISYLNSVLGDLCFFDQEYSEAIVSYQDALQSIRNYGTEVNPLELMILSLRITLKIGLTYEKMKSYELSLGYYSAVATQSKQFFTKYGSIDRENLLVDAKHKIKSIRFNSSSSLNDLLQVSVQGFIAKLYLQEKLSVEGVTMNKVIFAQLAFQRMMNISKKILKSANTEIFSNFYINVGTLLFFKNANYQKTNVERFFDLTVMKKIDFHRRELYSLVGKSALKRNTTLGFSPYAYSCYKIALLNQLNGDYSRLVLNKKSDNKGLSLSDLLTNVKLQILSPNKYDPEKDEYSSLGKRQLKILAIIFSKIGDILLSYNISSSKGNTKGDSSAVMLYEIFEPIHNKVRNDSDLSIIFDEFLINVNNEFYPSLVRESEFNELNQLQSIRLLISIYYVSSKLYEKAGVYVSSSFQLRKIIHILRIAVSVDKNNDKTKLAFKHIEGFILKRILEITSWNSSSTDRPQTDKFEFFFGNDGIIHHKNVTKNIYKNISNSPEIKEALLFFAPTKVRSWDFKTVFTSVKEIKRFNEIVFKKGLPYFNEQSLLSPDNSISSQFTRVLELSFQEICNSEILDHYISKFISDKKGDNIDALWNSEFYYSYKSNQNKKSRKNEIIRFFDDYWTEFKEGKIEIKKREIYEYYGEIVVGSIYSLYEILKIINISGVSYMLSYSFLANYHRKLGAWLRSYTYLRILHKFNRIEYDVNEKLSEMIGSDSVRTLDSTSQFQLAAQNYRRAIQLHSQGETYQRQLRNMLYLEDDYNDNLFHYCAAIERQQIFSGRVEKYLKEIDKITQQSQMLDINRYWNID